MGFSAGFEFISAVRSTDCDSKRVDTRLGGEFVNLIGIGEVCVFGFDVYRVFDTREFAEFGFDDDTVVVRVFDDFLSYLNVFGKRLLGRVDHNRRKTFFDTTLAEVERIAVIKMQADGKSRLFDGGKYQVL